MVDTDCLAPSSSIRRGVTAAPTWFPEAPRTTTSDLGEATSLLPPDRPSFTML